MARVLSRCTRRTQSLKSGVLGFTFCYSLICTFCLNRFTFSLKIASLFLKVDHKTVACIKIIYNYKVDGIVNE